jgi:hypothetical protein
MPHFQRSTTSASKLNTTSQNKKAIISSSCTDHMGIAGHAPPPKMTPVWAFLASQSVKALADGTPPRESPQYQGRPESTLVHTPSPAARSP